MRVIKFRVFEGGFMDYDPHIWLHDLNDGIDYECNTLGNILMQYTGLKDKNGNEIYEGDIVKHPYAGLQIIVYQNITGGVGFLDYVGDSVYLPSVEDFDNLEVIGNIYEHPELIYKEKKDADKNNIE